MNNTHQTLKTAQQISSGSTRVASEREININNLFEQKKRNTKKYFSNEKKKKKKSVLPRPTKTSKFFLMKYFCG